MFYLERAGDVEPSIARRTQVKVSFYKSVLSCFLLWFSEAAEYARKGKGYGSVPTCLPFVFPLGSAH